VLNFQYVFTVSGDDGTLGLDLEEATEVAFLHIFSNSAMVYNKNNKNQPSL